MKSAKARSIKIKIIKNCARCGGTHKNLTVKRLKKQCLDYDYWAMCPTTNEPIIFKIRVDRLCPICKKARLKYRCPYCGNETCGDHAHNGCDWVMGRRGWRQLGVYDG